MKPLTCFRCDYTLTGLPDVGACPECGEPYGDALEVKAAMRGARGYGWRVLAVQMASITVGMLLYIVAMTVIRHRFAMTDWFNPAMIIALLAFAIWVFASLFLLPRWARPLEAIDRSFDVRLRMDDAGIVISDRASGKRRATVQWEKVSEPVTVRPHRRMPNEYELDFRMRIVNALPFRMRIIYIFQADEAIAKAVEERVRQRVEKGKH